MIHILILLTLLILIENNKRNSKEKLLFNVTNFNINISKSETLNWIFFADEKTEDPTPKKLQDARKKGQVPKSPDLISVFILLIAYFIFKVFGNHFYSSIYNFLKMNFSKSFNINLTRGYVALLLKDSMYFYIITVMIILLPFMVGGVIANLLQTGFVKSGEPLKPKLSKLNPIEGFKKIFSKKSLFNLVKTLFKLLLVGYIAYSYIKDNLSKIFSVTGLSLKALYPFVGSILSSLVFRIVLILGIISIVDFIYQKYDFKKGLKMTKHEVKEEFKQMEGDPMIKSQRRQKQRQMAMNRMISDIPDATVIITNPTHLAIAIKYDNDGDSAPIVVAKGADYIAKKIRETAKEHKIPILENKPLARTLYKNVEINEEIPIELYQAVAEILAIVYQMEQKNKYY